MSRIRRLRANIAELELVSGKPSEKQLESVEEVKIFLPIMFVS
jgi:hypothetical protein